MRRVLEALQPFSSRRIVRKGSIIVYQSEVPRSAFIIGKGLVKAYTLTNTGNEQIVTFLSNNEPVAAPWLFKRTTHSLYYYEAVEDTELYALSRDDFHQIINEKPELKDVVFEYLATINSGLLLRITALEQQRAIEKIVFTLYYLMFRFGEKRKDGLYRISLRLTHNSIANMVGLTRETTATELARLKRKGVLDYTTNEYIIDKAKLERIMGEDSFRDLNLKEDSSSNL